jgi:archaellin
MKENTNETRDELAAIGIGAMIVFIALILVAAVAAAVII